MNKEYLSCFISILSLIISGIAIAAILFRKENLSVDYLGVFAGILSLLVVFSVGWQIINAMEVKKELDKAKNEREKLNEEMNKNLMSIVSNVCDYMGDIAEMVSMKENAHWEYFITSIKFYNKYNLVNNKEMSKIAKIHVLNSMNMEFEQFGEVCPVFYSKITDNLNIKDVTTLRNEIEKERSEDKFLCVLNNIIKCISNQQKLKEKYGV